MAGKRVSFPVTLEKNWRVEARWESRGNLILQAGSPGTNAGRSVRHQGPSWSQGLVHHPTQAVGKVISPTPPRQPLAWVFLDPGIIPLPHSLGKLGY